MLALAGERARGKTMYVTLEPCSHHGRTPPCADAILQAGIARVVCPIEDPDPRVSGKGVALLRQAGVTVDLGAVRRGGALDGGRPHPAHDAGGGRSCSSSSPCRGTA